MKYMINSKEDLIGVLNLTIDNAPIIPNDNPRFPAIGPCNYSQQWLLLKKLFFD